MAGGLAFFDAGRMAFGALLVSDKARVDRFRHFERLDAIAANGLYSNSSRTVFDLSRRRRSIAATQVQRKEAGQKCNGNPSLARGILGGRHELICFRKVAVGFKQLS